MYFEVALWGSRIIYEKMAYHEYPGKFQFLSFHIIIPGSLDYFLKSQRWGADLNLLQWDLTDKGNNMRKKPWTAQFKRSTVTAGGWNQRSMFSSPIVEACTASHDLKSQEGDTQPSPDSSLIRLLLHFPSPDIQPDRFLECLNKQKTV